LVATFSNEKPAASALPLKNLCKPILELL